MNKEILLLKKNDVWAIKKQSNTFVDDSESAN